MNRSDILAGLDALKVEFVRKEPLWKMFEAMQDIDRVMSMAETAQAQVSKAAAAVDAAREELRSIGIAKVDAKAEADKLLADAREATARQAADCATMKTAAESKASRIVADAEAKAKAIVAAASEQKRAVEASAAGAAAELAAKRAELAEAEKAVDAKRAELAEAQATLREMAAKFGG